MLRCALDVNPPSPRQPGYMVGNWDEILIVFSFLLHWSGGIIFFSSCSDHSKLQGSWQNTVTVKFQGINLAPSFIPHVFTLTPDPGSDWRRPAADCKISYHTICHRCYCTNTVDAEHKMIYVRVTLCISGRSLLTETSTVQSLCYSMCVHENRWKVSVWSPSKLHLHCRWWVGPKQIVSIRLTRDHTDLFYKQFTSILTSVGVKPGCAVWLSSRAWNNFQMRLFLGEVRRDNYIVCFKFNH